MLFACSRCGYSGQSTKDISGREHIIRRLVNLEDLEELIASKDVTGEDEIKSLRKMAGEGHLVMLLPCGVFRKGGGK